MCSSCGSHTAIPRVSVQRRSEQDNLVPEDCSYTVEMLQSYLDNLVWFKNSGAYLRHGITAPILNSYIGIVLSALNFNSLCRYNTQIEQMEDTIDMIINIRNA